MYVLDKEHFVCANMRFQHGYKEIIDYVYTLINKSMIHFYSTDKGYAIVSIIDYFTSLLKKLSRLVHPFTI